jgi:mono/diheme cytochrome c family protein
MFRPRKALAALIAASALVAAACAGQPPTGATTGAPVPPGATPTAAPAPAPTRPAPTATTPAAPGTTTPGPAESPTAAPATPTTAPSPPPGGGGDSGGNPTAGRAKFTGDAGCSACHGDRAQGGVFPGAPKLSGTTLTLDQVKAQIRSPRDPSKGMPPFSAAQVSDQDIANMYAWFKTNP